MPVVRALSKIRRTSTISPRNFTNVKAAIGERKPRLLFAIVSSTVLGTVALLASVASQRATADLVNDGNLGNTGEQTFISVAPSSRDISSVNVASGNLLVAARDPLADPMLSGNPLVRYYNSQQPGNEIGLGAGWTFSDGPDVYLSIYTGFIGLNGPTGTMAEFDPQPDGSWKSSDTFETLTQTSAGYTLQEPDGSGAAVYFDSAGNEVGSQAGLGAPQTSVTDETTPGGESVLQSLTGPDTPSATLGYVGDQPLSLSGPDSDVNFYTENGPHDELATFEDAGSNTTRYGYNTDGLLSSITEPDGTSEAVTYQPQPPGGQEAVTQITVTPPSPAEPYGYTFAYADPTSSFCKATDIGQTTVTPSGDGPTVTYCYTSRGVVDNTNDVDTSPPDAVSNLDATRSQAGSDVEVSWDVPGDPPLMDGDPGSGVSSYQYRYRVGTGTWSSMTTTQDAGFTIPGTDVPDGAEVTVEISAIDAAGNEATAASLSATVDISGTKMITFTPPSDASGASTAHDTVNSAEPDAVPPGSYDIVATLDCQCYNGQKTIAYRRGYLNPDGKGFGRAKVLGKHNMWTRVVGIIVGGPGHDHQHGTRGTNVAYAIRRDEDGNVTEITLFAAYDTRFRPGSHRSFGIVNAYCKGYVRCPEWVNEAPFLG